MTCKIIPYLHTFNPKLEVQFTLKKHCNTLWIVLLGKPFPDLMQMLFDWVSFSRRDPETPQWGPKGLCVLSSRNCIRLLVTTRLFCPWWLSWQDPKACLWIWSFLSASTPLFITSTYQTSPLALNTTWCTQTPASRHVDWRGVLLGWPSGWPCWKLQHHWFRRSQPSDNVSANPNKGSIWWSSMVEVWFSRPRSLSSRGM